MGQLKAIGLSSKPYLDIPDNSLAMFGFLLTESMALPKMYKKFPYKLLELGLLDRNNLVKGLPQRLHWGLTGKIKGRRE